MSTLASDEQGGQRALAGRYRLRAPLGRGAYGEVWDADDLVLGERVAIKWLLHAGPESARVRSEIATLRLLRLPGVVRLLDEGTEDGRPFFVMERVEGTPFPGQSSIPEDTTPLRASERQSDTIPSDVLGSIDPLATVTLPGRAKEMPMARLPRRRWLDVAPAAEALLEILARVHVAGIVHRDLKPENVLVRADGCPVVLDFGIALGRVSLAGGESYGQVIGTPAYMAPEQMRGDEVEIDARADLYAVGVMLYDALTGSLPHEASNIRSLMLLRATTPPVPVRDRAPEVPPSVAALVDCLLAIDPEGRPRSAAGALAALRGQSEGRGAGSALLGALGPGPIPEVALRELFVGPDRFFHLREDGARALWARTAGVPARVAEELDAWVRAGIARWDGDRIVIERTALDELGVGPPIAAATFEPEGSADVPAPLSAAGSEDGRRRSRRALAETMLPGESGRLVHLVAAGEDGLVAAEALALALRLAQEGSLGPATAALHEGLLAVRQEPLDTAALQEQRLLSLWVEIAFAERRPHALDRVLYEICRSVSRASPGVTHLEGLVRVGLVVDSPSGRGRAGAQADALGAFDDPAIERWRQWVRVRAGLRESPEAAEAAVAGTQAWAERTAHPAARASVAGLLGLVRYEQGRFDEAARCHAEAAASEGWLPLQLAATLNEAGALLDALQPDRALVRARAAGEMAARCRHPYFEARAEWIRRTAAFRVGETQALDPELVEASLHLGTALLAMVCFTEAAIAYRAGSLAAAGEQLDRAIEASRRVERHWLVMFGRCMAAAVRGVAREEAEELIRAARGCPVTGLGLQALALLRRGCPSLPAFLDEALAPLCRDIPEDRWDARLDVLSVRESLAACRAAPR